MATRTTRQRTPPTKRAMSNAKRAAVGRKTVSPDGTAGPLARSLEERLTQVVEAVEKLAQREASDERLVELAYRVMELKQPASVTVDTVVAAPQPPGTYLDTQQQRLVLNYDALLTALGRLGAASIVLYRVVGPRENKVGIRIESGHVDDGSQIVVYGSSVGRGDGHWGELGRAIFAGYNGTTWIQTLNPDAQIDRLEVLDRNGRPVRLGRPLPPKPDQVEML